MSEAFCGDPMIPHVPLVDSAGYYMQSIPEVEWVDLPCGCKVRMPQSMWWSAWHVMSPDTVEVEEEYDWKYNMSCPCTKYDLYYHKGYNTWAFMKDNELSEEDTK